MGVYIKGLRKPPKCEACVYFQPWVHDRGDDSFCPIAIKETRANDCPSWCPITEVKPHGRLIDADELMLKIQDYIEEYSPTNEHGMHDLKWCAMKEAEMAINDAPTIIEAEGEE